MSQTLEPGALHTARSIQEFWIDFLLEEEFRCDSAFASAFAAGSGLSIPNSYLIDVAHSVTDQHGEADLVVIFTATADPEQKQALLIENKITAGFQPKQAERYRARGSDGQNAGRWQGFRTVLVAPEKYIQPNHGFDAAISLELLSDWVCRSEPARRKFKIERLDRAIKKKNSSGVQIVDQSLTEFREAYRALLGGASGGFIPPAPRLAYAGDYWVEWTSANLPGSCKFRHRLHTGINSKDGALDLSLVGVSAKQMESLASLLPPEFKIITIGTGNPRGAIECRLPAIKCFADFETARPVVESTLAKAERMQAVVLQHGMSLLASP